MRASGMRLVPAVLLAAATACGTAYADIRIEPIVGEDGSRILIVSGPFEATDDVAAFVRAAQEHQATSVTFDSPGGNVVKAIEYGRAIRSLGLSTFQLRRLHCASACSLTFAGGVTRAAEPGSIGVHQSSFAPDAGLTADEAVEAVQALTGEIIAYLTEMGVDANLLQLSLSTEKGDMRYLTLKEMAMLRVTWEPEPQQMAPGPEPEPAPEEEQAVADEPASDAEAAADTPEDAAVAFVDRYLSAWSGTADEALAFIDAAYGRTVWYQGKLLKQADYKSQMQAYLETTPQRSFTTDFATSYVTCETRCEIDLLVDWSNTAAGADAPETGLSQWVLVWNPKSQRIERETEDVLAASSNEDNGETLVEAFDREHKDCIAGEDWSPTACSRREIVAGVLKAEGMCLGRESEVESAWTWHACEAGSLR